MVAAAAIVRWLNTLAADVERNLNDVDPTAEDLARLLIALRDCRADLATIQADLERRLLAEMGERTLTVEGVGTFEAHKKTKRSGWDHDGLWRRVVALALDERHLDEETGEYEPSYQAVARVLAECARPAWRVTPLRQHGIDVDEWCHVEPDGFALQIPRASTAGQESHADHH